jgi:diguanylate cyclase (GGDEF)-like protein
MEEDSPLVLVVGQTPGSLASTPWGRFALRPCGSLGEASAALSAQPFDALLVMLQTSAELAEFSHWQGLSSAVLDAGVVVVAQEFDVGLALRLIELGVQDVLPAPRATADELARVLRLALLRKRLERTARKAYATDLSTGLPNHAQLLEHMTHLLALREREPAPMALLVLRIEGLATTEHALGSEAANVLRRKLAVRVRAGLRASDVVAAIGNDAFAVLLAWIDAPDDALRVAGKLALALQQPVRVASQEQAVAVAVGVSQYPEHGKQADELLRRALGQASGGSAAGRAGFANRVERGGEPAANDE